MTAGAEIEQRGDRPLVEEWRDGNHESLRRQRAGRNDVDVLPGVAELDAGLEQRVDQAVSLDETAAGLEPTEDAAECDEPDAVAALEVPAGERCCCSHRAFECAVCFVASPGLGEAVQEEDDVGIPVGVSLVDDQLAAASTGSPVDRAKPIAGHEAAGIGELEPLGTNTGDEVTRRELCVKRCHEALQEFRARVDVQPVLAEDTALPDEHPDAPTRAQADIAQLDRAPAFTAER